MTTSEAFEVNKLLDFTRRAIAEFAKDHAGEVFYAFAIDSGLLCLNSIECFEAGLVEARHRWAANFGQAKKDFSDLDPFDQKMILSRIEINRTQREKAKQGGITLSVEQEKQLFTDVDGFMAWDRTRGSASRFTAPINPYDTADGIEKFRMNTGDWAYRGFVQLDDCEGWNGLAYDRGDESYERAMEELLRGLAASSAFACLRVTTDFRCFFVRSS